MSLCGTRCISPARRVDHVQDLGLDCRHRSLKSHHNAVKRHRRESKPSCHKVRVVEGRSVVFSERRHISEIIDTGGDEGRKGKGLEVTLSAFCNFRKRALPPHVTTHAQRRSRTSRLGDRYVNVDNSRHTKHFAHKEHRLQSTPVTQPRQSATTDPPSDSQASAMCPSHTESVHTPSVQSTSSPTWKPGRIPPHLARMVEYSS